MMRRSHGRWLPIRTESSRSRWLSPCWTIPRYSSAPAADSCALSLGLGSESSWVPPMMNLLELFPVPQLYHRREPVFVSTLMDWCLTQTDISVWIGKKHSLISKPTAVSIFLEPILLFLIMRHRPFYQRPEPSGMVSFNKVCQFMGANVV